jgi:N-acetylmuramoyl-L-alanine amidase
MPHLWLVFLAAWPASGADLTRLALPEPADAGKPVKLKVYVDAGHGAKDNVGASSCTCENEEVFTLRTAEALMKALEATGRFELKLSRTAAARPSYAARVAEAEKWKADVILGIHFDVRGTAYRYEPEPGKQCWRTPLPPQEGEPTGGFSILWSDEDAAHRPEREKSAQVGRALAVKMAEAGLLPYSGWDYQGLYEADPTPGAFIDRHLPLRRRVWMLKKPKVPSVIIETHHALDPAERARWDEPATLEVFAAAVAAALLAGR